MSSPVKDGQWGVERHHWDHMTCAGLCWGCGKPSRLHTDPTEIQRCLDNWGNLQAWHPETLKIKHFRNLGEADIEGVRKLALNPGVFNNKTCRKCDQPLFMVFDPVTRDVVWDHRDEEAKAHHFTTEFITKGGRV